MIVGKLVETAVHGLRQTLRQSGFLGDSPEPRAFADACDRYLDAHAALKASATYELPPHVQWDDKKYEGLVFGEISAMTQFNRCGTPLTTILEREDLHDRLVNGSDYPLPAVNVLIRTARW